MDFKESDITIKSNNQLETEDVPKRNPESIITFSPDRSRFDLGGQNHKSRNSSIASDFDLNLEVSYSTLISTTADIIVNQFSTPKPLTDLLSSSTSPNPVEGNQLPCFTPTSNNQLSNSYVDIDIINDFTLNPNFDLNIKQSQQGINNVGGNVSLSTSKLVTESGESVSGKMPTPCNGTMPSGTLANNNPTNHPPATSTLQLQKKLEKKIAQASAIAATMSSMSRNPSTASPLASPKEEIEFGEFTSTTTASNPISTLKTNESTIISSHSNSKPASDQNVISTSKSGNTLKSKLKSSLSNTQKSQNVEERKAACVKFQENEVEIISKSSRVKVLGGLIPPERLAVPNKSLANNGNRKHSKSKGARVMVTDARVGENVDLGSGSGGTSEVKPLVEWDSDESEEELSFFPANKQKTKLTDNLSIDNMSLSGDEDDLHLSPPRPMTQKCPCDPRQWINDHVRLPKSSSFLGKNEKCSIT